MDDVGRRERPVAPKHQGSGLVQVILLLLPPGVAFEQQQIQFALLGWGCRHGSTLIVHLPAAVAIVVVAVVASAAKVSLRRVGWRAPGDERSSDARARFMAVLALLSAGFSAAMILAQWLPALFIDPCQK